MKMIKLDLKKTFYVSVYVQFLLARDRDKGVRVNLDSLVKGAAPDTRVDGSPAALFRFIRHSISFSSFNHPAGGFGWCLWGSGVVGANHGDEVGQRRPGRSGRPVICQELSRRERVSVPAAQIAARP